MCRRKRPSASSARPSPARVRTAAVRPWACRRRTSAARALQVTGTMQQPPRCWAGEEGCRSVLLTLPQSLLCHLLPTLQPFPLSSPPSRDALFFLRSPQSQRCPCGETRLGTGWHPRGGAGTPSSGKGGNDETNSETEPWRWAGSQPSALDMVLDTFVWTLCEDSPTQPIGCLWNTEEARSLGLLLSARQSHHRLQECHMDTQCQLFVPPADSLPAQVARDPLGQPVLVMLGHLRVAPRAGGLDDSSSGQPAVHCVAPSMAVGCQGALPGCLLAALLSSFPYLGVLEHPLTMVSCFWPQGPFLPCKERLRFAH